MIIILPFLFLTGCVVFDAIFGVKTNADGTTTATPGGGIGGLAGLIPGLGVVGTVIGAAGTIYQKLRAKQWTDAATSTVNAVEQFKSTPDGAKVWEKLKAQLEESHNAAKAKKMVDKILGNKPESKAG
jgi:hypothetical protein